MWITKITYIDPLVAEINLGNVIIEQELEKRAILQMQISSFKYYIMSVVFQ